MNDAGFTIHKQFRVLSIDDNGDLLMKVNYDQLTDSISQISRRINSLRNCLIAITLPKHPSLIAVIIAILRSHNAFVYIPQSSREIEHAECVRLKVSLLISNVMQTTDTVSLFGIEVFFNFYARFKFDQFEHLPLCYVMQTSGTTGQPKSVMVPYRAIMPNIRDFEARFVMSASDVILQSTSLTFDPSVVELFLAFVSGSQLLLLPDCIRSRPALFAETLLKFGASFVQMTPSLLKLIPRSYLMKMFDENSSSIRILLLGGEAFPSEFLCDFVSERNRICIFNVYGITEVSCWASCTQWNKTKEEVDIGEPLLDTTFNISDEGELLIGGPRKCYLNGVITDDDWVATGDLVERLEDGRVVWRGRLDDQVKLNGIRVNLMEITSNVQHLEEVDSALAIFWRKRAIILFVKMRRQLNDIDAYLQKHITSKWLFSSVVFAINEWPLNEHGKIDRDGLLEIFKERNCSVKRENVTAVLAEYGIDVDKNKFDSLHSLGMTSLCATELMFKFEHLIEKEDFELLQFLLSETATVSGLLQLLQADNVTFDSTAKMKLESKEIIRISPCCDQYETSLVWEWDSGACIDATPIIHNRNVFIGSHSGRFASIRIDDGHVNWEVKLANRIEATANLQDGVIAVGCYDCCLHFIDEVNGHILWSFKTSDIVKSVAKFVGEGKCVIGSHDHSIYLLDYLNRMKLWQVDCGGGVLSSPLIFSNRVYVASLSGKLSSLSLEDGTVLWETQLKAPVFASPLMVDDGNVEKLLIVDVKGNIYSYEPFTAMKIDHIATEEGVFAAPVMLSKQIGAVVTQNSSVIIIHVQLLAVLIHLKIGSSPFVRSPFIDTSIDTLFLLNTTGQLFELKFNGINFTSPHSTNTAESLRSKDDHEVIQRVNPAHRVEIRRQTDSSVRHLNSKSSLANSIELSSSHASDSFNTINQSEANVNKLIRSVDLILSQNTETFGGVLIIQEKFCDQKQCIVYRALIGSRNDRLGCFIFTRKVV